MIVQFKFHKAVKMISKVHFRMSQKLNTIANKCIHGHTQTGVPDLKTYPQNFQNCLHKSSYTINESLS